jgi:phosphoenolpyruvate synthase/pyruvate phosphate dikinase
MSTKTLGSKPVSGISTLRLRDAEEAGGKGANIGELAAAGLPVPPGFVLTRSSYRASMQVRPPNQVESNAVSLGTNGPVSNRAEILSVDSSINWGGG